MCEIQHWEYQVEDNMTKCMRHYPGKEGSGLAIQLMLPDQPSLVIINIHGPLRNHSNTP